MTMRLALILAATALASANALAQGKAAEPKKAAAAEPPSAEKQAFLESCAARKFETVVQVTVDGAKRGKKVTLCGKAGQSDADWIGALKDAAKKVEANGEMAPEVKGQIVTALNLEIAKWEAAAKPLNLPKRAEPAPALADRAEYSVLPPMPKPVAPPPVLADRAEYSVLPPMPEPLKVAKPNLDPAKLTASTTTGKPAPAAKRPRLTVKCLIPGEPGGGGACVSLERDTLLAVRADEAMEEGASLRFLRRGDAKGQIALAQMRRGQTIRSKLPAQLCAGVASSKVEIQVVSGSGNQVVDRFGPYQLRC